MASQQNQQQSIGQKLGWLLSLALGTAFLTAAIPGSTQPILDSNFLKQNLQKQDQNSSDINEILKLLPQSVARYFRSSNYSFVVDNIAIVENYAVVHYGVGNNGSNVLFRKRSNRWKIVSDSWNYWPENDDSREGVPKNIAIQLRNQLQEQINSSEERLQKFRRSWSSQYSQSPEGINFLGRWQGFVEPEGNMTLSFWPSNRPNTVCVVALSTRRQIFEVGTLNGIKVKTPTQTFSLERSQDPVYSGPFTIANTADYKEVIYPSPLNIWYYNQDTLTKLQACQQEE